MNQNNSRIAVLVVIGGLLLTAFIVGLTSTWQPKGGGAQTTTVSSPFTGTDITSALNGTGGSAAPDSAVNGQYVVLGLSSLPLPAELKPNLAEYIGAALSTAVIPPIDTDFIQINTATINCADQYDCRFSFYLDSPERYFAYHLYYHSNGNPVYTLESLPLSRGQS